MAAPIKLPKAPKAPKAPKVPKAPDPAKAAEAAKKKAAGQAKGQAKKIVKRVVTIAIILLVVAIVALVIYLLRYSGPAPSDVVAEAVDAAFMENEDKFKELFTPDSVDALESAWSGTDIGAGVSRGSWKKMMKGILTEDGMKPKILSDEEKVDGDSAQVTVQIDELKRTIHLAKVDDKWLINVNLGIDPNLVLPEEEISEEIAQEFEMGEAENEMWWEEREAAKAAKEKEKKGCLGCTLSAGSELAWGDVSVFALFAGVLIGVRSLSRRRRALS